MSGSTAVLLPYRTPTSSPSTTLNATIDFNLPTPTPTIYTVVKGDTLIGIAERFGISLDALKAANPGVDPRQLSLGMELVLPSSDGSRLGGQETPTPAAVTAGETQCYSTTAGELWCFFNVENTTESPVENLTAVVQILSANGNVLATLEATPLLNLLASGDTMPLVAYAKDPPHEWARAQGQLLSAYAVANDSDYYRSATVEGSSVAVSEDGLAATATGQVKIQDAEAGIIWILAVAHDASGNVVGIRRWESSGETEFTVTVYSLGLKISNVDLLIEARD